MKSNIYIFSITIIIINVVIVDIVNGHDIIINGNSSDLNNKSILLPSPSILPPSPSISSTTTTTSSSLLPNSNLNQILIQPNINSTTTPISISSSSSSSLTIGNINIQTPTTTTTTTTTTTISTHHDVVVDNKNVDDNHHNNNDTIMSSTTATVMVPTSTTTTTTTTLSSTTKKMMTKTSHKNKWSVNSDGNHNQLPYRLNCSMDSMIIQVNLSSLYTDGQMSNDDDDEPYVYLEKLRSFSICRPKMEKFMATFVLSLQDDFYRCGTTKIHDQITGTRIYYNRIVVETKQHRNSINGQQQQRSIYFKCSQPNIDRLLGFKVETSPLDDDDDDLILNKTERIKRETTSSWIEDSSGRLVNFTEIDLPENFMEAEVLDFTDNITARAPYPHLNLKVKRNGKFVNQSLNVAPGTPLEMIIYLDDESKHVYGLLASFMKVTDNTNRQQEVIVLNGCSIDPYIFGNFESNDGGDSISAKFRAFKFPESNYVMFIGTVNVCLDKCQETPCGNGIYALGRRRRRRKRSLPMEMPKDPNKVFEIEMMAYLRIGYSDEELAKHRIRQSTIQATGIVDQTKSMITESGKNPPIVAHLIDNKQNENNDDAQYESLTSSFSLSSASSSLIMIKSISNYSSHLFSIIFLLTFSRYIIFHY